jgi:hypothetical protein
MTTAERQLEALIIVSIAKVYSEQSTLLTNELGNLEERHKFKQSVKYIDKFIKSIEKRLEADEVAFLQNVTDAQLNALADMRVELHKQNNTNQSNQTT